jgi:RNA polymerase sigma-70 factor (ECF subfamily)
MSAVMAGDGGALEALVTRHQGPLLGFLYRLLDGDRAAAEDLVQDTFLRLLQQRSYLAGRPFKPWLYAIAVHLATDHRRARDRRPSDGEPALDLLPDPRPGPEERAAANDETRRVGAAMSRLAEDYRVTLVLRFGADLSLREIAETLGVPVGTVKSRLSVGTHRLRALLAGNVEVSR